MSDQMGRGADITNTGTGLRRPDGGLALGASDGLPDVNDSVREIQITSAQPADLTGPEPTPASQEHRQALPRW